MDVMQYDDAFISVYECMPGWLGLARRTSRVVTGLRTIQVNVGVGRAKWQSLEA